MINTADIAVIIITIKAVAVVVSPVLVVSVFSELCGVLVSGLLD